MISTDSAEPSAVRLAKGAADQRPAGLTGSACPEGRQLRARVRVAAFSSAETRRIGRELGFDVAVIAAVARPSAHAAYLSRRWHAAWTAAGAHWYQAFDDGLADPSSVRFSVMRMDPRWMGRSVLPRGIEVDDGTLSIDVPPARRADFGTMFAACISDREFDRVARRPAQVRRRFATGRPLPVAPRYAGHPGLGVDAPGFSLVSDLFWFRPQDLPSIAKAMASAAAVVALSSALADLGAPAGAFSHA